MAQLLGDKEMCKENQILWKKLDGEVFGLQVENDDDEDGT